jgi:cytolysin (calcineurin-like family phosphatase)
MTDSDKLDSIIERLDFAEIVMSRIANRQILTQQTLREIQKTMPTQADVDAITEQLDGIKSAVAAQGVEIAKIGSDLVAFIAANPTVSLADLQAKATEVGTAIANAGTALQSVDDLLPEQA